MDAFFKRTMDQQLFNEWCQLGEMDEIRQQVEAGFDINYIHEEWSPLMIACFEHNFELSKYLLSKGANINIIFKIWKKIILKSKKVSSFLIVSRNVYLF